MKNGIVKINYLYNSSFKVETENFILIFDYYNEASNSHKRNSSGGVIGEEDTNTNKKILVFATHSHGDHFSEAIFKWREQRTDIEYILSHDIDIKLVYQKVNVIAPYEQLSVYGAQIKAFGSTDLGVSLLVNVDGINIFHAGDLNWWHWYDESTEFNTEMERMFKEEVEKIKGAKIDVAFFPVDPRLRESYDLGPSYFIKEVKPKSLIPMHFREDFYITKEFASANKDKPVEIYPINKRGEQIFV